MIIPGVVAAGRSASSALTELTVGLNSFNYSGSLVRRVVPANVTTLQLKLWGGGGGHGNYSKHGGGGGYVYTTIAVEPGDLIFIQVGGGAGPGKTTAPREGGAGGWPDGGDGSASNSISYGCGGGGGSSRVFRNGALVAVAGGGGGGGNISGGAVIPQGGGLNGAALNWTTNNATGGNQTTGGFYNEVSAAGNPASVGGYLRGGRAWYVGDRFTNQPDRFIGGGGGGGGGYYGGGAAPNGNMGGGGSSWFDRNLALEPRNRTVGGFNNYLPAAISGVDQDLDYPGSPIGEGAFVTFAASPTLTAGNPGVVLIRAFEYNPVPVRVTQQTADVLWTRNAPIQVTHQTVEVLTGPVPGPVRVTHQTVEIIRSVT